ncbi:MAG: PQQ-dependent sugar dehydrogenase [Paracoccaceae bacterium]
MMRKTLWHLCFVGATGLPLQVFATVVETSAGPMEVALVADGLVEPWGIAFLPDGRFLVTERDGALWLFAADGSTRSEVADVPAVAVDGQGGLLDVMVPQSFAASREIWLSYAEPQAAGSGTAAAKARLSDDGMALEDLTVVFSSPEGGSGGRHFGSRLVEAADGTVFLTIGDRGTGPEGLEAQDGMRAEGKVIHLNPDGSPATTLDGMLPGVFSTGHRNAQGAAIDANGQLWVVEHGAQGGDELNRVERGRNYGWPVIAYGENYGGGQIGVGTEQGGMEQPVIYWDPSMAPSGLMFYSGALVSDWAGDAFVGSLKFDYLGRLDSGSGFAEEKIETPETARVRAVVEGPDGAIWFLSVGNGAVYRMAPVQ